MSRVFSHNAGKRVLVSAVFCLLAMLPCAFATSINGANTHGALLADQSDDLDSPGKPAADYGFPGGLLFSSNLGPSDDGFFDLGLNGFLMTGNTFYNFTGDP